MAKNGLKFITKATFTAASSVSIDGCFSATYTHYVIKRNLLGSAGGLALNVRLRVSATDASGADYRYQFLRANSTAVDGARTTGGTSWLEAMGRTQTTSFGFAELWVCNPFDTVRTTAWTDASGAADGSVLSLSYVYAHDLTTSYDGFSVIPNSGTITGSISVFGLVKS